MYFIQYKDLLTFTEKILKKVGLDYFSNKAVSLGLCEASLRGVDSHGIRLLDHYVSSSLSGRKNPKPNIKIFSKFPASVTIDADNAFGHSAGFKAVDEGIKSAKKYGISQVNVFNSSHPGALASMTLRAARRGFIAFAFTHADSLMLSYQGVRPFFGTNPISFAAPRVEEEPYCLDMATSLISWNKLKKFREEGVELEENIAADSKGIATNDPFQASQLFPIGKYKGFGLASMIDILCGVNTGMNFARSIPSMFEYDMNLPRKLGQSYIIMRTDLTVSKKQFKKSLQDLTDLIRNEPSQRGNKVLCPNDPEIACSKERLKKGIPLEEAVLKDLQRLSQDLEVNLNLI
jgi:LDH2 family malate/lactate/ureidoglycolate dehydrogenase